MDAPALARHLGTWSRGTGSLHQKLAVGLMKTIRDGVLTPGVRLPSERSMAGALRISRTTVVGAYDLLRERLWLESRSGSGTWVSARSPGVTAARNAAQASALAASPLLGLLSADPDAHYIDLALGTPAPLFELPGELFTLTDAEQAALVRDRPYHPLGLPALRHAIASEYAKNGFDTDADQILVTNGAQQAIALCAMLCLQRGDTALVEDPAYFGALEACRAVGARIAPLPVGPHGVTPSVLNDRIVATGARLIYLTPTFQNPTGTVIPAAARKEIARMVDEFGIPLIDDRTMADFVWESVPPPPVGVYATSSAPVLTIGSLGKLVWAGLRIGWIRGPAPWIQRLARLKTAIELSSPLHSQAIAVRLVAATSDASRLRQRALKPRRDLLARLLQQHLPAWRFRMPTGGLFLWVQLPRADASQFAQVALRHGVVTFPGTAMSAVEEGSSFLRVPFFAEPDTLRAAVDRLSGAWREYQLVGRERHQSLTVTY